MSELEEAVGPNDRDIIKAKLLRRMFGVRSISSFPNVVQGDMALGQATDVIEIVLTEAAPLIAAAERERIAQTIEAEASASSYRDRDDVTEAYLDSARIALNP